MDEDEEVRGRRGSRDSERGAGDMHHTHTGFGGRGLGYCKWRGTNNHKLRTEREIEQMSFSFVAGRGKEWRPPRKERTSKGPGIALKSPQLFSPLLPFFSFYF